MVDGVGELANMITGGIKNRLAGTPWRFGNVTVPSVIVGRNYHIAYSAGLQYLCATFEQTNEEALSLDDRLLKVAVSLSPAVRAHRETPRRCRPSEGLHVCPSRVS